MKPAYILQLMLKVIGVLAALFDFSGVCSSGDEVHDGHGRPGEQAQGFLPLGCRGQGVCVCTSHISDRTDRSGGSPAGPVACRHDLLCRVCELLFLCSTHEGEAEAARERLCCHCQGGVHQRGNTLVCIGD